VTTKEIANNISDVSAEIADVNHNVNEGATATEEIAKEITMVEDGARKVQENSSKLNDNALALSAMADSFMDLVKKFKV
jgi:methyl-accepting chemotaxis protein